MVFWENTTRGDISVDIAPQPSPLEQPAGQSVTANETTCLQAEVGWLLTDSFITGVLWFEPCAATCTFLVLKVCDMHLVCLRESGVYM